MNTALVLVLALLAKHFLIDFVLQTSTGLHKNKHDLSRYNGYIHALTHGAGTFWALLFIVPSTATILIVSTIDTIVHFIIDYSKASTVHKWQLTPTDREYWYIFGTDQWLHCLTYVVLTQLILNRT